MFIVSLERHIDKLRMFSLGGPRHWNIFTLSITWRMHDTVVFRTLSDEDGVFCENDLKVLTFFTKKLHLICLTGF